MLLKKGITKSSCDVSDHKTLHFIFRKSIRRVPKVIFEINTRVEQGDDHVCWIITR